MRTVYLGFVAAFLIMAAGFWPTTFGAKHPLDALHMVHGSLAATWMAMLVAQSWLAGRWRLRWHRRIGWASVAIVPALVVSSLLVVRYELAFSTYFSRDLRLTLTWLDLWSLVAFCGLWGAAIAYRRRWPLHARYVGSTVFIVLPPALGRLLGGPFGSLAPALPPTYVIIVIAVAGLLVRDVVKGGHPLPYALTLLALVVPAVTMFAAPGWPWFVRAVEAVAPIG